MGAFTVDRKTIYLEWVFIFENQSHQNQTNARKNLLLLLIIVHNTRVTLFQYILYLTFL